MMSANSEMPHAQGGHGIESLHRFVCVAGGDCSTNPDLTATAGEADALSSSVALVSDRRIL